MSGTIVDFFGFRTTDASPRALTTAAQMECPFLNKTCSKVLGRTQEPAGACAIAQVKDTTPVICCPIRLYADNYKILSIIIDRTFGKRADGNPYNYYSGRVAVEKAKQEGGAVAVYGHGWGGELRLPKRDGVGNYFADWVLALIDGQGMLIEFTSIEVQTIDTTGNYAASRTALLYEGRKNTQSSVGLNWENVNKRILPQVIYKGQVLQRESLCKSGLWFVTPAPVYERILARLGNQIAFGYQPQPGAIHFLRYDYDNGSAKKPGAPTPLKVVGDDCTTVEKVQAAFNNVALPEANVYGTALKQALFG